MGNARASDAPDNHANSQQNSPTPGAEGSSDQTKATKQLNETLRNSTDILASATTVFPFTLFPNTATIDREKLNITNRVFFRVAEVVTIPIPDITHVTADVGPIVGSIRVHTHTAGADRPYAINYMRRPDAIKFKRILQGYIIALKKGVDYSALNTEQLRTLLSELGKAR